MPKHERPDFDSESMEAILRADEFIDALALGRPSPAQDAADAELAALLGNWRDEMRWPPASGLITEEAAVAALNAGRSQKRPGRDRWVVDTEITPRKNRRGLSVVGAAAAAVLCIGGFGAVVAGSGPGDGLYGLRTMLFGTPKEVRDDQVGLAAKTTLNQVQDLIAQGDWSQAQNKLVEVSTQVASIGDQQQKQDLLDQFNDLSAKVVERDPAATAPPGVVYTVPPSAAELVPAVAPPSDSSTSASSSSSSEASATSAATTTSAAPTTTPTTAETSAAPTTAETSAVPTTSSAPVTTSDPSTPAAATSSQPASSSAPTAETQQTTTPTSGMQATSAPVESPTAREATTTAAPTTAVPSTTSAPEPSPASEVQVETTPVEAPVTTTELVPVPAG